MWDLAVREKDFQAVDSMLARYRGSVPLNFRLVTARGRADSRAVAAMLDEGRRLESRQLQLAARYTAAYLDDTDFADSITRLDLAWRERPVNRAQAQVQLGWIAAAQGRWTDALANFELAERMEGAGPVVVHIAMAATLPFLEPPPADLDRVRVKLERWRPDLESTGQSGDPASLLRAHLRFQLLALVAIRVGNDAAVGAYRLALMALPVPDELRDVVRMMVATIDAERAFRRGRHAEVLALLDTLRPALPLELLALARPAHVREFGFEHARYLRAVASSSLGNDAEAQRWLQHGIVGSPQELVYRAPIHLELARIHERMRDPARAREHYEAALRLWARADQPLQPRLTEARERLKILAGASHP